MLLIYKISFIYILVNLLMIAIFLQYYRFTFVHVRYDSIICDSSYNGEDEYEETIYKDCILSGEVTNLNETVKKFENIHMIRDHDPFIASYNLIILPKDEHDALASSDINGNENFASLLKYNVLVIPDGITNPYLFLKLPLNYLGSFIFMYILILCVCLLFVKHYYSLSIAIYTGIWMFYFFNDIFDNLGI